MRKKPSIKFVSVQKMYDVNLFFNVLIHKRLTYNVGEVRRAVEFGSESHEAVGEEKDAQRVAARHEHVEAEVELEAVQKQRMREVALYDA